MIDASARGAPTKGAIVVAVTALLVLLALVRPIDHDESQYVAAAALTADGLLPYRDFAYLQTPLQPFLVAPIVWAANVWTWPVLRLVNALLGVATVGFVVAASRAWGARPAAALAAGGAFLTCDILLFAVGTARNDALPAACLAVVLWMCAARDGSRSHAALVGLVLAAAAATKLSYIFPGTALGLHFLIHRRARVGWALAGALPVLLLVAWTWSLAPRAFLFEVVTFPHVAPTQFYADQPWKLTTSAKLTDAITFLALGAGLPALATVARVAWRERRLTLLDWLVVAGLLAALAPSPTWRQYLLPALPPLFVRLAVLWNQRTPSRSWRIVFTVFGAAGLATSVDGFFPGETLTLMKAMREREPMRAALDANGMRGPIATLSPQFLPAVGRLPDARFATGSFYFRSRALLTPAEEHSLHLVSYRRAPLIVGSRPVTVLGITPDRAETPQGDWDGMLLRMAVGKRRTVAGTGFVLVRATAFRDVPPSVRK